MLMKSLLEAISSKINGKLSLRELLSGPMGLNEQPLNQNITTKCV